MDQAINYFLAFGAAFVGTFFKSFQQKSVQHTLYAWILPVSLLMTSCEVMLVVQTVHNGWGWIILPIGIGAGLGSMLGMYLHEKVRRKHGQT